MCWRRGVGVSSLFGRTRWAAGLLVLCATVLVLAPRAKADGFRFAAEVATNRVVKLYGLGAGVQVNYGTGVLVSSDGQVLTVLSLLIDARRVRAVDAVGRTFEARVVRRDEKRQLALLQLVPWATDASSTDDFAEGAAYSSSPGVSSADASVGPFAYFDVYSGQARDADRAGSEDIDTSNGSLAGLERPSIGNRTVDRSGVGGRPPELQPGDWVVAAGNAFKVAVGAEPVSITHGIFSARTRLDARRRVRSFQYRGEVLMIDAITSNPGAPGGAVVDLDGRLVGLIGRVVLSNRTHTHVNYAVPRDVLSPFVRGALEPGDAVATAGADPSVLREDGTDGAIDVGIRLNRAGYRQVLPFVERVRRGSPAARAGVRADDLILSINGRTVSDVKQVDSEISFLAAGEPFDVVIRRGRRILSVRIEPEGH